MIECFILNDVIKTCVKWDDDDDGAANIHYKTGQAQVKRLNWRKLAAIHWLEQTYAS